MKVGISVVEGCVLGADDIVSRLVGAVLGADEFPSGAVGLKDTVASIEVVGADVVGGAIGIPPIGFSAADVSFQTKLLVPNLAEKYNSF